MGYVATDIATVPSVNGDGQEFKWYIFIMPGRFPNKFRDDVLEIFHTLSGEVGKENLVIVGADRDYFHFLVVNRYKLYLKGFDQNNVPLPALLVTDTAPADVKIEDEKLNARIIIFPLGKTHLKDDSLSDFLRQLCVTLQDVEAFDDIAKLERKTIIEKWGWIPRYFNYKLNIFGFEPNFSAILEDIMKALQG
jgi:hypothetical protein